MMKERTHNAAHFFSLVLICFLAWHNSQLTLHEQTLQAEHRTLQKDSAAAAERLSELEHTAADMITLGERIDHHDFSASQFILAHSNKAAPAPISRDELDDDHAGHGCVEEPWFDEGVNHSHVGKRLASLQRRLGDLSQLLTNVNANMEKRKVALDSVPTILPILNARISSPYGIRRHPRSKKFRMHRGVDLEARYGDPVHATAYGVVERAGSNRGYGLLVTVAHDNGIKTQYAHNSKILVKKGDVIAKGQVIAKVGASGSATGTHCHYEVVIDGAPVNPELFVINRVHRPESSAKQIYVDGTDVFGLRKNNLFNRIL